MIVKEA